jgi:hypothetical protein
MEVQLEKRRKLDADISSQPGVDKMEHKKISELEKKIAELEKKLHLKEIQEIAHAKKISKLEDSLTAVEKAFLQVRATFLDAFYTLAISVFYHLETSVVECPVHSSVVGYPHDTCVFFMSWRPP